jgi:hypothetical protein
MDETPDPGVEAPEHRTEKFDDWHYAIPFEMPREDPPAVPSARFVHNIRVLSFDTLRTADAPRVYSEF